MSGDHWDCSSADIIVLNLSRDFTQPGDQKPYVTSWLGAHQDELPSYKVWWLLG